LSTSLIVSDRLPLARMIPVVGAEVGGAKGYVQKRWPAEVNDPCWHVGTFWHARKALELKGAPVTSGIRRRRMEWAIGGILRAPATMMEAPRSMPSPFAAKGTDSAMMETVALRPEADGCAGAGDLARQQARRENARGEGTPLTTA